MAESSGHTDVMKPSEMDEVRKIMHNMDAPQKRTIQAASYLSVKHALPKTCINHSIIHENPCQERVLNIELERIRRRRKGYNSVYEVSRRTFLDKQARKQRKWKQQDQMRIASMNFPTIRASAVDGRSSVEVIYRSPRYSDAEKVTYMGKPLLPYMILRRERTEFIRSHKKISTTRLPDVVETDNFKLKRYNTYCGEDFDRVVKKEKQIDKRFEAMIESLSPLKATPDLAQTVKDNADTESVDDGTKYWFIDDDVSEGSIIPKRGLSRDSMRKATVVFPAVMRSQTMSGTSTRRPSLDREKTQYDISLKKTTPDKPKLVGFPEIERATQSATTPGTRRNSQNTNQELRSPQRKTVDPSNPIVTELKDNKKGNSEVSTRKGILKSQKDSNALPTEDKRDKIKQDIQKKGLKELKDTYGSLKDLTTDKSNSNEVSEVKTNPRESSSFHSPTMGRRFAVKSAKKST